MLGIILWSGLAWSNPIHARTTGPDELEIEEGDEIIFVIPSATEENTPDTYVYESEQAQAFASRCRFTSEADNPHISSDGSNQASAHGGWKDKSKDGSCPEKADVEVWLQVRACKFPSGPCGWITKGHREGRIKEGFRSGRRVTARADCASNGRARWRNVVDVDIPEQFDYPFRATRKAIVSCTPHLPD